MKIVKRTEGNLSDKKNELKRMSIYGKDLQRFLTEFQKYVVQIMERDIPNVENRHREQLSNYIIEYIKRAVQKRYFNSNNIVECLNKIIDSVSSFHNIGDGTRFGECSGLSIGFNFSNGFAIKNMRHIIFHELTHSVAPFKNQNLGKYAEKDIHTDKTVLSEGFKTKNRSNEYKYEPIISEKMVTFLREIVAESTACDLAETYKPIKTQIVPGVYSDWLVPYNRSYQNLGYEFLQTLIDDINVNERELFKNFTISAMNSNDNICEQIIKIYQSKNSETWKEDLHEITTILGDITSTHILDDNKIIRVRELMGKYIPKKRINIISSRDMNETTPKINIICRTGQEPNNERTRRF